MLKFRVVGQRLIWENPDEVIVADTKKYLECYFEFDGDAWRGYKLIDAYFKKGRDNPIRMVLSSNRIWREDGLCLSAGEWSLYLCATEYATRTNADGSTESIVDRQITSSVVTIKVLASGQMTNAENSFKSPEIADQYIAKMSVLENARVSAENARADAERARVSAEASRTSAEAKRVSAEAERSAEMRKITESLRGKMTYRGEVEVLPENAASGDVYKVKKHIYRDGYCRVMLYGVTVESIDDNTDRVYFAEDTLLFRALKCAYEAFEDTGCALEIISGGKAYTLTWVGIGDGYIDVSAQSDATVYLDIFPDEYGFIKVPLQYAESDVAVYTASILVPEGGMAVYDGEDWIPITAESLVDLMAKVKVLEDALAEAGNSSGGGFRKIGFTEDCDFVATTEDGLTAFKDAVEAASDGETFYVMPGKYVGSDTLTIAKNLNFVGIGMPTIEFPIYIYGEGEYEFGGGIITPIVTYTTNWSGIHFANTVEGFQAQNYMSPLAYSAVNSDNCIFEGLRNRFVGNHFQSKLIFEDTIEYNNISLGSGFEPAEGCVFESCDLIFRNFFTDFIKAENCNISFEMRNNYTAECSYIFKNCNVYNYGEIVLTNGQYLETFVVENCNVFGAKFFSEATASGNYLFSGTAL